VVNRLHDAQFGLTVIHSEGDRNKRAHSPFSPSVPASHCCNAVARVGLPSLNFVLAAIHTLLLRIQNERRVNVDRGWTMKVVLLEGGASSCVTTAPMRTSL